MQGDPQVVVITGPPGTGKSTLASSAAAMLGAPVLGWDWAMAALTGFGELQRVLEAGDRAQYRSVGWSILWNLATQQLRDGRSVILDGLARADEIAVTRDLAGRHGAACTVVVTRCSDPEIHRTRVVGRIRAIPGWHELDWADVARTVAAWEEPPGADLVLDAAAPLAENVGRLAGAVGSHAA